MSLTDASTDQYKAVYVTVDDVHVHLGGNENSPNSWQSVPLPTSPLTVNLLELVNGVREGIQRTIVIAEHQRKKRGRKPLPVDLPRVDIIHDISEEERFATAGLP